MAAIKNSIQLQDRMTPVFRSIIKSMDSTLKVMQRLDKQANKGLQSKAFQRARIDIDHSTMALQKMQNQIIQANNRAEKLSSTMAKVASHADRASNSMRGMSSGISLVNLSAALYLLENIKDAIKSLMEGPDIAMSTKARLGLFNESQYSKEDLYDQLYQTSLETRTGLEETGNLVTRIMISGAMKGENSAAGSLKAAEIINKALIAGGGTSEENRRSLLQLSQALASGMLQGDELRAIREQTPYLTSVMAQGMGKVDPKYEGTTIGDMKQLGKNGELTSDVILKSIFAMEEEVDTAFKKMPRTFGQATTMMGSMWMYFLDSLNTSEGAIGKINAKIWELVDYLTSADGDKFMNSLAQGINTVVNVLLWGIDLAAGGITWLIDHGNVLSAVLLSIGTAALIGMAYLFASSLAAYGPIILLLAGLSTLYYLGLESGKSTGDMVSTVATSMMILGNRVVEFGIAAYAGLIWLSQGLVMGVTIAGDVIKNIFLFLGLLAASFVGVFIALFYAAINEVSGYFTGLAEGALNVLSSLASAIDLIFGTSMASTVNKWKDMVTGFQANIETTFDVKNVPILSGDPWKDAPWADFDAYKNLDGGTAKTYDQIKTDIGSWNKFTDKDALALGDKLGKGIDNVVKDKFDVSKNYQTFLKDFDPGNLEFTGGNIDEVGEVGKIKSDVELSDEDIRLLRDIAAKDFLINLNTIAPVVNANFGDINEKVDVEEIMGAIEDMILNAYATSLVTD